jgi:hypothetical protein
MSYQERSVFRGGEIPTYPDNPELQKGLDAIEEFQKTRAHVALEAAKHIATRMGGETLDLGLYYTAMFGRTYEEGESESDPKLLLPLKIIRDLSHRQGQPILIRDVNYPDMNVTIGVIDSFSDDSFEPTRLEVAFPEKFNQPEHGFMAWDGDLTIAIRQVWPTGHGEEGNWDYKLTERKAIKVCLTGATFSKGEFSASPFIGQGSGGNRVNTINTDVVDAGTKVFLNAEFLVRGEERWLANQMGIDPREVNISTPNF